MSSVSTVVVCDLRVQGLFLLPRPHLLPSPTKENIFHTRTFSQFPSPSVEDELAYAFLLMSFRILL